MSITTKSFLIIVIICFACLTYFAVKNPSETDNSKIDKVRDFASFIKDNPQLVQNSFNDDPTFNKPVLSKEDSIEKSQTINNENELLTLEDRTMMYDMVSAWNDAGFVRNSLWLEQVETVFAIAERTKAPDALDIIQTQIYEGKKDADLINQNRAALWLERYMRIEPRAEAKSKMENMLSELPN